MKHLCLALAIALSAATPAIAENHDPATAVKPTFPGGDEAMAKYLVDNLIYPMDASKLGIRGEVLVGFDLHDDGSMTNFRIIRGVHPLLDAEAMRLAKRMPAWTPVPGHSMETVVIPVNFNLSPDHTVTAVEDTRAVLTDADGLVQAERAPRFPGGMQAMIDWLGANTNYPEEAARDGVEGRVTVQFVIRKDGTVSDVKVARGKHPALDAEAVRVVQSMPRWEPGFINGEYVNIIYMLPITFSNPTPTQPETQQ